MRSEEHHQGDGLRTSYLEVQEVAGVTEELIIVGRSRDLQPNGFGQPDPQVSIDRIV